jgi:hypothetical protein
MFANVKITYAVGIIHLLLLSTLLLCPLLHNRMH